MAHSEWCEITSLTGDKIWAEVTVLVPSPPPRSTEPNRSDLPDNVFNFLKNTGYHLWIKPSESEGTEFYLLSGNPDDPSTLGPVQYSESDAHTHSKAAFDEYLNVILPNMMFKIQDWQNNHVLD